MFVLNNDKVVFFDVDNTLVIWDAKYKDESIQLTQKAFFTPEEPKLTGVLSGFVEFGQVHERHIELIKFLKFSGFSIVVWSQAGAGHATRIIKQLNLENFVDAVMAKPTIYYDDKPFEVQGIRHRYLGKVPELNY